jgi:perosamine synthetase
MELIRIEPPQVEGQVASFKWSVEPASELYHREEFVLRFPPSVDLTRVPAAVWWRVALLCLHSQWPLLRPCRVVLPVRLDAGEREFWLRLCDAAVVTLEATATATATADAGAGPGPGARAGRNDVERRIEIIESGPRLQWPKPAPDNSLAVGCFSGGRDSLVQAALLQELGLTPILVSTSSPREGSIEHTTARRAQVMAETQQRRGVELVEVESTLRGCWDLGFAARTRGYEIGPVHLGDTILFFAAALVVAVARGASAVYMASEAEVQESTWLGGQIVRFKDFAYAASTQHALSALVAPLGIRYGGLTYPLRQFQVQRLLSERYRDLQDLQYSCWSMADDEAECSRCSECRVNGFNLMANGISPAEIGIDPVMLLSANADWEPRTHGGPTLLNARGLFDAQVLRCLQKVTPEVAVGFIEPERRHSAAAAQALEGYERMRARGLTFEVEPEPGYRASHLRLLDERLRSGLAAIFDEHFEREDEAMHAGNVERSLALSAWISAPLTRPELSWRTAQRPLSREPVATARSTPPDPIVRGPAELAQLGELLPGPEPVLAGGNGVPPLYVAETLLEGNELKYVTECIRTNWISSAGSFVPRFESAFAEVAGCEFGVACTSGTTALHLALAAAGLGPGDEVIVPTFTMIASPNAVGYVGATPVLVDTDPETWNLDLELVRDRIGPRTRAIMIVHTYGHPVDADAVMELADANGLIVIEDAAEAHGAKLRSRPAGSLGTVGAFSFYGNKILATGEGGMVTTNDPQLASVARELRDHGFSTERHFWHRFKAFNFRMSNLQAAVGLAQVERLDELVARRAESARLYRSALAEIPGIELPPTEAGHDDANWMFGVLVGEEFGCTRDELRGRLAAEGIETRTFFIPIHVQPSYSSAFAGRRFPVAERLGARGLYLPSGPRMGEAEVARVAAAVARARVNP